MIQLRTYCISSSFKDKYTEYSTCCIEENLIFAGTFKPSILFTQERNNLEVLSTMLYFSSQMLCPLEDEVWLAFCKKVIPKTVLFGVDETDMVILGDLFGQRSSMTSALQQTLAFQEFCTSKELAHLLWNIINKYGGIRALQEMYHTLLDKAEYELRLEFPEYDMQYGINLVPA